MAVPFHFPTCEITSTLVFCEGDPYTEVAWLPLQGSQVKKRAWLFNNPYSATVILPSFRARETVL